MNLKCGFLPVQLPGGIGDQLAQPAVGRVVLKQRAPGHFELQWGDIQRWISQYDSRIVTLEQCRPGGQGDNQVILLGQGHGSLIVAGKHSNLAFFTQLVDFQVHPAQPLHDIRVHANPHAHTGVTHPPMLTGQVNVPR